MATVDIHVWVIGLVMSVVSTGVPVLFYVLSLKVRADILAENKELRKDLADIRLELVKKMGETHTCNQVMGEKLKTMEARVGHIEGMLDRVHARMDRLSTQLASLLSRPIPAGETVAVVDPEITGGD